MKKIVLKSALILSVFGFCISGDIPTSRNMITIEAASSKTALSVPTLKIKKRTATTADLNITKVKGASSYKVYRATKKDGKYTYVGSTKSTTFKDDDLKATKTYYYKVRAYVKKDGKKIHSKYSKIATVKSTLKKPSQISIKNSYLKGTQTISCSKVDNASKYSVYRLEKKTGKPKFIGSTNETNYTVQITDTKTYYYKVRAYKNKDGIKYHGVFSSPVSKKFVISLPEESNPITPEVPIIPELPILPETPTPEVPIIPEIPTITEPDISNDGNNTNGNNANNGKTDYASQVLTLVNKERANAGLSKLTTTTQLNQAATKRANEIVSSFAHTRPNGSSFSTVFAEYGITYRASGENIAWGQTSPQQVMEGWMNSSGHRANILGSQFGKIGIGCIEQNGRLYWVQLFTN